MASASSRSSVRAATPACSSLPPTAPAFEARALLRRAARETGAIALVAHPALIAALQPEWIDRLAAQVGGAVSLRPDPALAMAAAYAHRL